MNIFRSCPGPAGVAARMLFLVALVPAPILAQELSDIPSAKTERLAQDNLRLPGTGAVTNPGDMESLLRDARMRSAGASPATPPAPTSPSTSTPPSLIPPLAPSLRIPQDQDADAPLSDIPQKADDSPLLARSLDRERSDVTAPEDAGTRPGSYYIGTIRQSGFFELIIHGNAIYALQNNGTELALPESVRPLPVLGSELSYVTISAPQEQELGVPRGLYIFAADGSETAFLKSAHAEHCRALYLSPDEQVLAIDMGGNVNHHLFLLSWPSRASLDVELNYYPGSSIETAQRAEMERRAARAAEAAEEALAEQEGTKARERKKDRRRARKLEREKVSLADRPLVWHSGHGLIFRIMNTDTARPCGYEPCGVVSVRSWFPHEDGASERVLCAGTELCDCAMDDLLDRKGEPFADVSMQCTRNIGEWRTRTDKKTSFTLEVPVR